MSISPEAVESLLEQHIETSGWGFRGVRLSSGWHEDPQIARRRALGPVGDPVVNEAIAVVDRMGLSLDCWLYHTQLDEVAQLADAHPELTIVLNHVGSPILGGPYRGKNDDVFAEWKAAILRVSERHNVFVKLGAMPIRMPSFEGDRTRRRGLQRLPRLGVRGWRLVSTRLVLSGRCTSQIFRCKNAGAVIRCAGTRLNAAGASDEKAHLFAGAAARAYRMERFQ